MTCKQCGRPLTSDEVALHKRLVNRGASAHLCLTCLAGYFGCGEDVLREKIAYFRRIGCLLFAEEGRDDQPSPKKDQNQPFR